ncbi:MAG: 5-(carboxyamino)imidazole ribonucleotide mutase [Deltaproteobacteria bacterium]|nr:5-(carboxyamino)imidazole ribonucleotide mutase [Deltaproteobacteria bacterium]
MKKPLVGILMGSDSDIDVMEEGAKILKEFKIPYERVITSAHRSPKRTILYAETAASRGLKVLIAGAGAAAHLAGVVAAHTTLPVVGVPIDSSSLRGLDSILSTVQMPGGVPVAGMAIGKAGSKNAGLLAVEILALSNGSLTRRLTLYRKKMERDVIAKNKRFKKS